MYESLANVHSNHSLAGCHMLAGASSRGGNTWFCPCVHKQCSWHASFSVGANAVGWPRGNLEVEVTLYISNNSSGPWVEIFYLDNTCSNSTSCSTASGLYGSSGGSCYAGAWYKAVGKAWGPGGAAENNPDVVKKYIYGTSPASTGYYPQQCTIITTQI